MRMPTKSGDYYTQIIPTQNGFLVKEFLFNLDEYRWEEQIAHVFTDRDVMLDYVNEQLKELARSAA